jgi:serine/threonine-protein kinase
MSPGPPVLPPYVGRYQISAHLSGDSIDDVYKGFDPLLERPVVVRVFPLRLDDPVAEQAVKETFYEQMQRAGMLTHHGIATLFDAGEWESALFMASEYVDAINLSDLLASRIALDLPMRVAVLAQIVDALEFAREAGVAHLQLRPSSVLVAGDFSLKLGGFGVAAVVDALTAASGSDHAPSRYAAPERLHGRAGDQRSDVYSLAVLALDVLAGGPVPPDSTRATIPSLPAELAAEGVKADRWAAVFERALAEDPDDRFDTPAELEVELLLTLGLGAAEARAARETARADAFSLAHPAPLTGGPVDTATMLVSDRERTTRPAGGDATTTSASSTTTTTTGIKTPNLDDTHLGAWPNADATSAMGQKPANS